MIESYSLKECLRILADSQLSLILIPQDEKIVDLRMHDDLLVLLEFALLRSHLSWPSILIVLVDFRCDCRRGQYSGWKVARELHIDEYEEHFAVHVVLHIT